MVVVPGGNSGIGLASALDFAAELVGGSRTRRCTRWPTRARIFTVCIFRRAPGG
jgi:NAD(P)-dependent dehydrogenase (short-subunit alcohol dehydrogenase family)